MKINILMCILLTGLVPLFFSSQSFAVSKDIKTHVKECYDNSSSCEQAKESMKKMVGDKKRTEGDRLYALIYLAIFSLEDKNVKQAKDFFCQIMTLKPDFDPDLSVCEITEDFKTRFNQLKKERRCPSSRKNCGGTFLAAIDIGLPKCRKLLNDNIIMDEGRENAFTCYTELKKWCSNHPKVQNGFKEMEQKYVKWTNTKIEQNNKKKANEYLNKLRKVNPISPAIRGLEQRISQM